jgi:hypothetical protein
MYHERIREFLFENHIDPTFNSGIEMGKTYIIACEKGIKKPVKRSLTFAKEV